MFTIERLESGPQRFISLRCYSPTAPRGTIIMAPAMAVPAGYYQHFCQWLSEQNWRVLSFDYYGIGDSTGQPLKQLKTTISDWAQLDCQAVIAYARSVQPNGELVWFAHSIGGQLFGMIPNYHLVDRMITVATGSGYWRDTMPTLKYLSLGLWYGVVPWLVPMLGYFPGDKLGVIGNVPGPAMQQWRRWCLHHDYIVGAEDLYQHYADVQTPITAYSFTDDEMLTQRNIDHLHDFYCNAPQQRHIVTPAQFELDKIGHFGVFRRQYQPIWPQLFNTVSAHQ